MRPRRVLPLLLLAPALPGCGEDESPPDPAADARRAAIAYVTALRERRWDDACARMTAGARAAVADGTAGCVDALAGGAALPADALGTIARLLPGAPVAVDGDRATVGPVADLPGPLRLARRDGGWLVAR